MFKTVDKEELKGYTGKYEQPSKKKPKIPFWSGLTSMLTQPYAFGIFGLICGYELLSTLITYRMQCLIAVEAAGSIKQIGSFMFGYTLAFQTIGLFIAIFGTTQLPKLLGIRVSLMITPVALLGMTALLLSGANLWTFTVMMVAMRALNYGFNIPVREMLFIPTSSTIQFLTKGWIESFGKTFSKTTGSLFNYLATFQTAAFILPATMAAIFGTTALWTATAFLMGGAYQRAIKENRVIGGGPPRA